MYLGAGTSDVMCPSTAYGTCNVQDHAYIPKRTLVPVHIMHCCVLIFVLLFAFLKICFTLSYLAPIFASIHHWWGNIIFFFPGFLGHSWECKPSHVFERYFTDPYPSSYSIVFLVVLNDVPCAHYICHSCRECSAMWCDRKDSYEVLPFWNAWSEAGIKWQDWAWKGSPTEVQAYKKVIFIVIIKSQRKLWAVLLLNYCW